MSPEYQHINPWGITVLCSRWFVVIVISSDYTLPDGIICLEAKNVDLLPISYITVSCRLPFEQARGWTTRLQFLTGQW